MRARSSMPTGPRRSCRWGSSASTMTRSSLPPRTRSIAGSFWVYFQVD